MSEEELRDKLLKYKVALRPNKQPAIWRTLCETLLNRKQDKRIKTLILFFDVIEQETVLLTTNMEGAIV